MSAPTMPTVIRLADLLHHLGDTPDTIAATLHAAGITGVPVDSDRCPIANYLSHQLTDGGEPVAVSVSQREVFRADDDTNAVRTPRPVVDFINLFDSGAYPHLADRADQ